MSSSSTPTKTMGQPAITAPQAKLFLTGRPSARRAASTPMRYYAAAVGTSAQLTPLPHEQARCEGVPAFDRRLQHEAFRKRIPGIQQVLRRPGEPGPPGDGRN